MYFSSVIETSPALFTEIGANNITKIKPISKSEFIFLGDEKDGRNLPAFGH